MTIEASQFKVEPEIITGCGSISYEELLGFYRKNILPESELPSTDFVDLTPDSLTAFLGYRATEAVLVNILEGSYGKSNEKLMVMFPPVGIPENGWSGNGNGGKGSKPEKAITKNFPPPVTIYQYRSVIHHIR